MKDKSDACDPHSSISFKVAVESGDVSACVFVPDTPLQAAYSVRKHTPYILHAGLKYCPLRYSSSNVE